MIIARGASLTYENGTRALAKFDLHIKAGEIVYVVGASGSGKTSLLKLLMGIEYPTTGGIKVLNQPISKRAAKDIRELRKSIGPIFQDFKLIKGRTALENVMMGMRFLDLTPKLMGTNAREALYKVGLENKSNSLIDNLSWGECQRVAIARAVARKPFLILADEPTGNLDVENSINILELLTSFRDEKTSVILTTHAIHLIEDRVKDKLIHIKDGNLLLKEWVRP